MKGAEAIAYLDCAASCPPDPAVAERVARVSHELFANAASIHSAGVRAAREVERARIRIASRVNCPPEDLFFTSGGTESNNMAIKGAIWSAKPGRKHLVVSAIEHPSVLQVCEWLERTGQAELTRVPVSRDGIVAVAEVERALRPETVLLSVMHANNEVGSVQPIAHLGKLCRGRGILFHTDACQSFLKEPIDVLAQNVDLLTINGHKVHGPKGVGALYVRSGIELAPLLHGGGHERGARSGTLNVPGIAGFGEAVFRFDDGALERLRALRATLLAGIRERLPSARVNGADHGLCTIVNLSVPGVSGKWLFTELDRRGIAVSASSACHSTKLTPSHVLKAMGRSDEEANEAIRISIGRFTAEAEIERLLAALSELRRAHG